MHVEQGGRHHAADGAQYGQRGAAQLGQFADQDFTFDFEADYEEEQRHQAVVDPMVQAVLYPYAADIDSDGGVQQMLIGVQ